MTYDEAVERAVAALGRERGVPPDGARKDVRVVLDAVGWLDLRDALERVLDVASRSDAHPDVDVGAIAREALGAGAVEV